MSGAMLSGAKLDGATLDKCILTCAVMGDSGSLQVQ